MAKKLLEGASKEDQTWSAEVTCRFSHGGLFLIWLRGLDHAETCISGRYINFAHITTSPPHLEAPSRGDDAGGDRRVAQEQEVGFSHLAHQPVLRHPPSGSETSSTPRARSLTSISGHSIS
ncbi:MULTISPECIES: hypothetical protein [unclassified Ensifer]|uniref:hypothetical protein n=1 Tax=unclassified Ensifer TaxID=2633371 RepID=UPI00070FC55B|nr:MULTISPECIES: hypothetical protein [unclassified Ensifer]KQW49694.1 hypothetical protein ASD02_33385 [Ensifer sp. Root1252]KRC72886.1 hypothetical protein ASE32_33065 [Ensifer sp. Root231]KRC94121.1 hypothetical protein ASE47_34240 [Ensifer sp. Root258]